MSPLSERVTLKLTPIDVARIQLDRAIHLLSGEDYVSATTLAGAAETLLGDLLRNKGRKHALDEIIETSVSAERGIQHDDLKPKGVVSLANFYRDRLKHLASGETMTFSVDFEAASMIQRACENYVKLLGKETKRIREFREFAYFGS